MEDSTVTAYGDYHIGVKWEKVKVFWRDDDQVGEFGIVSRCRRLDDEAK